MDPGCGKQTFPIALNQKEPNVMMVVDESGSMKETIGGTPKWDVLKSAVKALISKYDGKVNWGLSIFPRPGGQQCDAGQIDIAVGTGTGAQIVAKLDPLTIANIGGATPTESTLSAVEKNGGLNDGTHSNYVLLMTDGIPTCNQDGRVTPVISSMYNKTPSIRTFVVGIGDGTNSNPQQLNDWAVAGHTDRAGMSTKYYQANNITDLQGAFENILQGIASCTYQLGSKPTDPNLMVPYLDGTAVPADPANGYSYDAASNSLTFHGTSCDKVKAGGVSKIDLIFGCPSPPII